MDKHWIALYSHSGTELLKVYQHAPQLPLAVFSDQKDTAKINPGILPLTALAKHEEIMEEIKYIACNTTKEVVITLHGYMRIIPSEIIDLPNVSIYNVHPGDIVNYPQLRGKDPQEKALELNLPATGVVIHRVDEGIDTGKIMMREVYLIRENNIGKLVYDLRYIAINMWINFLGNIL